MRYQQLVTAYQLVKNNISKVSLSILFFLCLGVFQSHAQVTSDGNLVYQEASGNTNTITGFSVPSGVNSVLVVYALITNAGLTSTITYDGTPMTKLGERTGIFSLSIWYLPQGDLTASTIGDIVANFSTSIGSSAVYAISYKNVDQVSPLEHFGSIQYGTNNTSSVVVASDSTNDLIVDFITARRVSSTGSGPTITVGLGQTEIDNRINQLLAGTGKSTLALSEEMGTGGNIGMNWTISGNNNNAGFQVAANINGDITVVLPPEVPTLSEWGLLNLALLLMICGVLYLIQPKAPLQLSFED